MRCLRSLACLVEVILIMLSKLLFSIKQLFVVSPKTAHDDKYFLNVALITKPMHMKIILSSIQG